MANIRHYYYSVPYSGKIQAKEAWDKFLISPYIEYLIDNTNVDFNFRSLCLKSTTNEAVEIFKLIPLSSQTRFQVCGSQFNDMIFSILTGPLSEVEVQALRYLSTRSRRMTNG